MATVDHFNEAGETQQNPLQIAYYFIKHPCKIICLLFFAFILICFVDSFGFEFATSATGSYLIKDDPQVHKKDQLDLAIKYLGESDTKTLPKTQLQGDYTLVTMFKTRDSTNILTPSGIGDYIEFIIETNRKITDTDPDEYYSFCFADPTDQYTMYPNCSSAAVWDPILIAFGDDPSNVSQQDIDYFVESHLNNTQLADNFLQCFEEDFEETGHSQYYRAFYHFGLPYPDINAKTSSYKDDADRRDEQNEYYKEWALPIFQQIQVEENDHENIEVVVFGLYVRDLQSNELTNAALMFTGGSILTVFLIMCWHLSSLFLACVAMLEILMSFPLAFAIYRYVMLVTFFDTLNTLVIFLILGIGADDVFVFMDAWVQSGHFVKRHKDGNEERWLIERMDFAYRRAAKAMIVTTATTFFAFMATSLSPIMPIAAFGLWAACVVFMNYILVISLFPACLSWWYQTIKRYEKCCCCCCCKYIKFKRNAEDDADIDQDNGRSEPPSVADDAHEIGEEPRCLETFLGETWANWNIKAGFIILPLIFIGLGFAGWKASEISPLTKQEQFFEEDHYMEKMFSYSEHFDGGAVTSLIDLQFVWGLEEKVDRTGVTFWDVDDYGKPVFDDDWNPSSPKAQDHLLYVCDILTTNYSDDIYDIYDYFSCWVYDFKAYGESLNLTFPFIFDNNELVQKQRYAELIGKWTSQTPEGVKFSSSGQVGFDHQNEFKFCFIEFKIPYGKFITGKGEIFDFWEDIMQQFNEIAPDGMNKGYQTSTFAWSWIATEDSFVISALQGVAIAIPLALLCLILSTQNWIISLYAVSAIIAIIGCEVALMVLQGWQLGISESIAVVMIVGFSVDYVVHLGNAYVEYEESDKREDRLKFSLFTMGISVVSGALTTFGSGFWLIFPEFLFFKKFGILVMSVVTFSLFFSMVYFIALLAKCGPQGKTGHVPIGKGIEKSWDFGKMCVSKCLCCCCGTIEGWNDENNKNEIEIIDNNNNDNDLNQGKLL